MTVLDLRGVDVRYGDFQALFGIDLAVEAGETVAVLGANGAGKSTLLKTMAGLLRPSRGEVRGGRPGRDRAARPPAQPAGRGAGAGGAAAVRDRTLAVSIEPACSRRWSAETRSTRGSRVAAVVLAGLVAAAAALPYLVRPSATYTAVTLCILVILGSMWNLLAGYGGLVSIGQQAYIGVGAYGLVVLADRLGQRGPALPRRLHRPYRSVMTTVDRAVPRVVEAVLRVLDEQDVSYPELFAALLFLNEVGAADEMVLLSDVLGVSSHVERRDAGARRHRR